MVNVQFHLDVFNKNRKKNVQSFYIFDRQALITRR